MKQRIIREDTSVCVSILILTLNEEVNLPGCLESVAWSDDIVVLDSYSTDRTVEIAKEAGVRVYQRNFDNWSAHQNWAVRNIDFKDRWVFYIDADERCDETLALELQAIDKNDHDYSAFRIRRKDYFMGKWVRRVQGYPVWFTRVFKPQHISYERLVNPVAVVKGRIGDLSGHLLHYPFSHGIRHWYARHNNYSDMEAHELLRESHDGINLWYVFSTDFAQRRRVLKKLAYRFPCRPFLVYLYLLFFRRAFLDGRPGMYYAAMRAIYEYMIDVKVKELRRREQGLSM